MCALSVNDYARSVTQMNSKECEQKSQKVRKSGSPKEIHYVIILSNFLTSGLPDFRS